ncbi:hypothetical protein LCGC14_2250020 [marine sediment metagenome]|uniref:Lipoprotein n=1 Tax=marine sediment metagenome TaxID=412755 RepID=A0A0F9FFD8_9ZZZZ
MTIAIKHFIHLFLLSSIVLINTGCATRLLMEGDRYEPDVEKQQSLIYSYTHGPVYPR